MPDQVLVRCLDCFKVGQTVLSEAQRKKPVAALRFRCNACGGSGIPIAENECIECGETIPGARLNAVRTRLCVDCAGQRPVEPKTVSEPWGSREAWKRDRGSWRGPRRG